MHPRAHLLLLLTGLLLASPAWAQFGGGSGPGGSFGAGRNQSVEPPKPAEPAALPGARSNGTVGPLTKPPSEMGPTEALFDSVNRGDIAATRDAVTRGADLTARNVLGLTALELSVDLSQNDITFFLLSLRGADAPSASPKPGKPTAVRQVASRPPPPPVRPAPAKVAAERPQPPSDGGTPVPSAGFLGFGGGR